ncbi:hypothetical protein HP459_23070 [Enterobacter sp. CM29]|nr:hypothetical protein [Enterobacter sp. CM29]
MWDDRFNKENVTSRIPAGVKISEWLARAFTLTHIKKFANKGQFALAYYYKNKLPGIEDELKSLQGHYLSQIKNYNSQVKQNPLSESMDILAFVQPVEVTINILPCPPVLMFIRVNMLCDEAHTELRKLYQYGNITKSDYFKERRELFKPLNKFRSDFSAKNREAGELLRSVDIKPSSISNTG